MIEKVGAVALVVMHPGAYAHMDRICSRLAEHVGEEVKQDVLATAPVDLLTVPPQKRGALLRSIRGVHAGPYYWVSVGTDYWHFTEYGTRPHIIRSTGPWQLRNRWVGKKFGWVVNHPGSDEQAYMRKALFQKRRLPYVGGI
jgi:hypothetical protein